MSDQFLIVTYKNDLPWLPFLLQSMARFAHGFMRPVIVVPDSDIRETMKIAEKNYGHDIDIIGLPEPPGKGQLFSQVCKCNADLFCKAETIWFIDSDCLITDDLKPLDFYHKGQPVMVFHTYDYLRRVNSGALIWQPIVAANLGYEPKNEFLQRMPMLYPRQIFSKVRRHIEIVHDKTFDDYVYGTTRNQWPQLFCESNVLGAWAYTYARELYHWSDPEQDGGHWYNPVVQFWSHGGFDRPCDPTFSFCGPAARDKTPREVIKQVLGADV